MTAENSSKEKKFQSHIGAIRIPPAHRFAVRPPHFNPTLVQLESDLFLYGLSECVTFQSHIGAIRMRMIVCLKFAKQYFNPTLVQLE